MSHVPNKVTPHATTAELEPEMEDEGGLRLSERAGRLAESATILVRENPKTAIAAGAALVAGVAAAAAIPAVRAARKKSSGRSRANGSASGSAKKKS